MSAQDCGPHTQKAAALEGQGGGSAEGLLERNDIAFQLFLCQFEFLGGHLVRGVPKAEVGLVDEEPYLLGRLFLVCGALNQNRLQFHSCRTSPSLRIRSKSGYPLQADRKAKLEWTDALGHLWGMAHRHRNEVFLCSEAEQ